MDDSTFLARSSSGSDASLLLVWATSGIFGLMFLVAAWTTVILHALKRRDVVMLGLACGLLVDSIFINSLLYPQLLIVFLILVAAKGFEPVTSAMM